MAHQTCSPCPCHMTRFEMLSNFLTPSRAPNGNHVMATNSDISYRLQVLTPDRFGDLRSLSNSFVGAGFRKRLCGVLPLLFPQTTWELSRSYKASPDLLALTVLAVVEDGTPRGGAAVGFIQMRLVGWASLIMLVEFTFLTEPVPDAGVSCRHGQNPSLIENLTSVVSFCVQCGRPRPSW